MKLGGLFQGLGKHLSVFEEECSSFLPSFCRAPEGTALVANELCIGHCECFVLYKMLVLRFLPTCYDGAEYRYEILPHENDMLCILKTNL